MTDDLRRRIWIAMADVQALHEDARRQDEKSPLCYVLARATDAMQDANDIAEGRQGWRVR